MGDRLLTRIVMLIAALALVAAACSDDDDGGAAPADDDDVEDVTGDDFDADPEPEPQVDTLGALLAEAPAGLDFYQPPDPLPGDNGDLIWTRESGPVDGGTAHLILYRSESVQGEPIAVSGLVFVPDLETPADGRPVFSWGNGTRGVADQCANSREDDPTGSIPILTGLLERNIAVVATDYEGLGTPGIHPYVIGVSEAHGMLDAIRATQQFTPAAANNTAIVGGQSQGGHAQAFANQLADDYAPEIDLIGGLGTSAGVVTVDDGIVNFLIDSESYRGILVMTMAAQQAAYGPELASPSRMLTDFAISEMGKVEEACQSELGDYFSQFSKEELFIEDWDFTLTNGEDAGKLNEPGQEANNAPQFLLHTRDDGLVPAAFVASYLENACRFGVPIEIEWWDGGHGLVYGSTEAQERALSWVDDRLAGVEPVDHCGDIPQP